MVVSYKSRSDTLACLASLAAQTHPDVETILVDNASDDGTVDAVRAQFPEVRVLAERENLGFAEGCNRGIAVATGAWIALLNNDAVAEPGFAAALVRAAERAEPRCGMLQALMLFASDPGTINSTGIELARSGGGRDRLERRPRREAEAHGTDIFCPTGGAAAYRRAMLDEVRLPSGWLDRRHFCYYEDMDLGWRARLAGWSARFVPEAVVLHRHQGTTSREGRAWMRRMSATNRLRTLAKNASLGFALATLGHTAGDVIDLLVVTRGRGLGTLAREVARSLADRPHVTRLARVPRREIERAWVRGPVRR